MPERDSKADTYLAGIASVALLLVVARVFAPEGLERPAATVEHAGEPIGRVVHRSNDVRRRAEGALVWEALQPQAGVYERDALYVAKDSDAVIDFGDGSHLELDENTMVVLRRPPQAKGTQLAVELVQGGAAARAGVGTELVVSAGGARAKLGEDAAVQLRRDDDAAKVVVAAGDAKVETSAGESVVHAGQREIVTDDGSGRTERLGVMLDEPHDGARLLATADNTVRFRWEPQVGVQDYVFELAEDASFAALVAQRTSGDTSVELDHLQAGVYAWRVRTEVHGRSYVSEERRLVLVPDVAPLLLTPKTGVLVDLSAGNPLALAWTRLTGASAYDVQVLDASGKAVVLEERVPHPALVIPRERLAEGSYCWRVRGVQADAPAERWSESSCFRLVRNPVLRAPELYEPEKAQKPSKEHGSLLWYLVGGVAHAEEAGLEVTLRWERIGGAAAYVVEVALDPGFAQTVATERVERNYLRFAPSQRRNYFWRVRAVDAQGREGRVSEVRRLLLVLPPPGLKAPPESASFRYVTSAPTVTFRWQADPAAALFIIEVADNADFSSPLLHRETNSFELSFRPPKVGHYFWRVLAKDNAGAESPYAPARSFSVVLAPPSLQAPRAGAKVVLDAGGEGRIKLSWSRRPAAGYEVQLATDEAFEKDVQLLSADEPQLWLTQRGMGEVYWRVRTRRPTSSWSASAVFVVQAAAAKEPPRGEGGKDDGSATEAGEGNKGKQPSGAGSGADVATLALPVYSFGPVLGFSYDLNELSVLRFGVEVSYLPPSLAQRYGLGLRASYLAASFANGEHLQAVPLDVLLSAAWERMGLRLLSGVALTLMPTYVSGGGARTALELGGGVQAGIEQPVAFGVLFAEMAFALHSDFANVPMGALSVGLNLGYRFGRGAGRVSPNPQEPAGNATGEEEGPLR